MTRTKKRLISILIILALVLGSVAAIYVGAKVIGISARLFVLRDNAMFYNEQPRKTNAMTEQYLENQKLRREIYNSPDTFVSSYSTLPSILKVLILFATIVGLGAIGWLWFTIAGGVVRKIRRHYRRCNRPIQKMRIL